MVKAKLHIEEDGPRLRAGSRGGAPCSSPPRQLERLRKWVIPLTISNQQGPTPVSRGGQAVILQIGLPKKELKGEKDTKVGKPYRETSKEGCQPIIIIITPGEAVLFACLLRF